MWTLHRKDNDPLFKLVFLPKMMAVTFPGKKLPVSNLSQKSNFWNSRQKLCRHRYQIFLVLHYLPWFFYIAYFYLALKVCCFKWNGHFSLQEKRTEKAGLLLDTTDVIIESSALNNNRSIEVKTDQIGNVNWQLFI